jgi:RNA polymerase sigma-70 factor (ECF subfamily)
MVSFEELYSKFYKDIYYFILKLTGYRDDLAEELTQESFYQAFVSLDRFRGECEIKTWLCQIAKNTYYKYLRTHAKETYMDEDFQRQQEGEDISTQLEKRQMISHIRKVIADLDERSRKVVEYRLFDEKPYKKIGELIGIREATAKVLFSRAKVKIRQRLKEEYGYEI